MQNIFSKTNMKLS